LARRVPFLFISPPEFGESDPEISAVGGG